eukprot:502398_1
MFKVPMKLVKPPMHLTNIKLAFKCRRYGGTTINHSFFSNGITSYTHAWCAGLLVTDGHFDCDRRIVPIKFRLDGYHMLSNILSIVRSDQKITFVVERCGQASAGICLRSPAMVDDLMNLFPCDFRSKSYSLSSSVSLFTETNKQYVPMYIRGVSDGDGSFGFKLTEGFITWSIQSKSKSFIKGLQQLINTHCFGYECVSNPRVVHCKNQAPSYEIQIAAVENIFMFGKWMYDQCEVGNEMCQRKYQRYLLVQEFVNNEYSPQTRINLLKQHKNKELRNQIEIFEWILSCSHAPSTCFHFTKKFMEREHLLRGKIELWKAALGNVRILRN